jgi:hypothetical protein
MRDKNSFNLIKSLMQKISVASVMLYGKTDQSLYQKKIFEALKEIKSIKALRFE